VQTPRDYFEQLVKKNYFDYYNNVRDMRACVGFCISAFHLHEWVFHFHEEIPDKIFNAKDEYEYADFLYEACPDFKVIRDFATYYKHYQPTSKGDYEHEKNARFSAGSRVGLPLRGFIRVKTDGEDLKSKTVRVYRMWEELFEKYDL
jgi:hypothetical protein